MLGVKDILGPQYISGRGGARLYILEPCWVWVGVEFVQIVAKPPNNNKLFSIVAL